MGEGMSRRLRTDAERAAEAWRQTAASRPGFVTYPGTAAGDPSWWRHSGVSVGRPEDRAESDRIERAKRHSGPPPVDGETCKQWCGYCHLGSEPARVEEIRSAIAESAETGEPVLLADGSAMITAPRRRWWHRLTRRNP